MKCTRPGCRKTMKLKFKDNHMIIYECACGWERVEEKG